MLTSLAGGMLYLLHQISIASRIFSIFLSSKALCFIRFLHLKLAAICGILTPFFFEIIAICHCNSLVLSDLMISSTKLFTVPTLMLSWSAILSWDLPDKNNLKTSCFSHVLLVNVMSDVYSNCEFILKNVSVS